MHIWPETHQSRVAFLNLLPVWRVIDRVVDIPLEVEDSLRVRGLSIRFTIGMTVKCPGGGGNLGTEGSVGTIHRGNVCGHREWAVNFGVFRVQFGLVKVISVVHICTMNS